MERGTLTISRRPGERIFIGEGDEQIIVTLVEVQGRRARLTVEAPLTVVIHREEVAQRHHDVGENGGG